MKRFTRDTWLALGLVVVLIITMVAAVIWQNREAGLPALSVASNAREGARALRLWLEYKGYPVSSQSGPDYRPPAEADLIFMLEPFYDSDQGHWLLLDQWVEAGGTLVVAGERWGADEIFQHYNFTTYAWEMNGNVTAQSPLLASPPMDDYGHLDLSLVFSTDRDDWVVLLAAGGAPVMITFQHGAGRVILASFIHPLTNAGLMEPGNPELILNLLALANPGDSIWFDEWHHGIGQRRKVVGPQDWLRYTPAGHALAFAAVILFLAMLLQGRSFGRPIPLAHNLSRRTSLEYITALANLSRRAGHRSEVLEQYHQSLKLHLARRYRLNPAAPDDEYVAQLMNFQPDLDIAGLSKLLKRLHSHHVNEAEMVQLAAETASWLKDR